jgi:hypothetical protein
VADEVQIKFAADAEPAIQSVSALREALSMLGPAMSEFSSSSLRVFRDQMQMLVDMKEMTTQQALGFDIQYTAQLRDQEAQRLQAVMSSDATMVEEKTKALDDLAQLDMQYTATVTDDQRRIADQAKTQAQAVQRSYQAAFERVGSSVQRTFNDILTRQTTWAKGSIALTREVESFFLTEIENMAAKWAASGLASLAGGAVSSAVSGAQATGASGLGAGLTALLGLNQPGGLFGTGLFAGGGGAAQAAAMTANTTALTASTTAITALTAALSGAAAVSGGSAAVSGLGSAAGAAAAGGAAGGGGIFSWLGGLFSFGAGGVVPSAAGGWALPHFAGAQPALLHAREMVLPAPISEGLQTMIGQGGGAGQHFHAHFHGPADAPAVSRWFRDNLKQNAGALRDLFRSNALTPRSL